MLIQPAMQSASGRSFTQAPPCRPYHLWPRLLRLVPTERLRLRWFLAKRMSIHIQRLGVCDWIFCLYILERVHMALLCSK